LVAVVSAERWHVVDYDGRPLPGDWPSEAEAVDEGLCGRYLLSGMEVRPGPSPEPDRVGVHRPPGGWRGS
jgi:hypothetical protein